MIDIIALITMIIDHVGIIFFPDMSLFRIIGRLAFPLFAYGITRGYVLTKNFKRYAMRLFLLAAASQIPFLFLFNNKELNVCFTLFIGLLTLKLYDSNINKLLKLLLITSLMVIAQILQSQYGFYGILTILVFYIFWKQEKIIYYQSLVTLISLIILRYNPIQLFSIFSTFIILFFNLLQNKDFKLNKIFRYGFYPIHLIILLLIKMGGF